MMISGNNIGLTNPDNGFLNAWNTAIVSPCTRKKETVVRFPRLTFTSSPVKQYSGGVCKSKDMVIHIFL